MIRVRLTTSFPEWPLLRQTPGSLGVWGQCTFVTDPEDAAAVDAWVVYEGLPRELTADVPQGRLLFVAGEPPSIRSYSPDFLSQFDAVITCQRSIRHPSRILRQQAQPWHAGVARRAGGTGTVSLDYDGFSSYARLEKTGLVSVVCSAKMMTEGHRRRRVFIDRARDRFGEVLALYGSAYERIDDKWGAIHPYTYHLVIENESLRDYWTEKLADAYLGLSFPIYHGCTNLEDYFPRSSYQPIDIDRPDEALEILASTIARGLDAEREAGLLEARRRVLDVHNLFPMLERTIGELPSGKRRTARLVPEGSFTEPFSVGWALRRLRKLRERGQAEQEEQSR